MQTNLDGNRLLNREEVEEQFGIPKRYLETAVCRGDGPRRVQIGRLVRYRQRDIVAWIEENTTPEVPK